MSKKNDDFFKEKKPWSEVKDELLGCYLKPYVSKILHTYKPIVYVDCFAGKGLFDDGKPGSPVIALDIIKECLSTTNAEEARIGATFIDLNYAEELKENLKDYSNVTVISGKYEDTIENLLKDKNSCNVFLYIDPYGIKALQCSMFDSFAKSNFNSIELLINMNSFGFIREACNAMGTKLALDDPSIFEDLIEYDPTEMNTSDKSINNLNEIAGGDYWQSIISDYKARKIDGYQAEERFAEQYSQRLKDSYAYVLNMPLRIRRGQRPKYRMIHATNHPDGCLLMVDNIYNRWEAWQNVQRRGQISFFDEDPNNRIVDKEDIKNKAIDHFSQYNSRTSLNESLAAYFMKYGPICKTKDIKDILRLLENDGKLLILRAPSTTEKGRPTRFMEENSKHKVSIMWIQ